MDMNSLLYVALGAILIPFLAKLGIKVPVPGPAPTPDPNTPTPAPAPFNLSVLINAIVTALIERFLPLVKETVRTELANRPVVTRRTNRRLKPSPMGRSDSSPQRK